ncbi:hypothetical protein V6N13_047862 [Hibiscus sabdariffa]|uniref:Uncharacterized protein n=1 Tax=Hibiscus sabdariffa TaxID=183260 RepID=A0ABR2F5F3_9ROSI
MEREGSPMLDEEEEEEEEEYPYLDMPEPLTLTKQQYQAAFEAVKKAYGKGNTPEKPVGEKKTGAKKIAGNAAKGIKKSRM